MLIKEIIVKLLSKLVKRHNIVVFIIEIISEFCAIELSSFSDININKFFIFDKIN